MQGLFEALEMKGPLAGERAREADSSSAGSISDIAPENWRMPGSGAENAFAEARLDACRIKTGHVFDKLSSLSNSRTRLLPHQIEATHRVAGALQPRFLLADEVGLGKTVEAGLILKELSFRRGYKNILIVVPASLRHQWRSEMKSKFNDNFEILERGNFSRLLRVKNESTRFITSLDFIKNEKYAEDISRRHWDLVVFDEAHRLRRDYSRVTRAYAFADQMARRSEGLLLLSATPFRGKLEELYYLIRLLDSRLLGSPAIFLQEMQSGEKSDRFLQNLREKVSRVMIRRRKIEVGGFTRRIARTVRFDLSAEERALYDETTEYVKREYNLARREENRAVGFIMIVFQKLLDSSSCALLLALEKRKRNLEELIHRTTRLTPQLKPASDPEQEWADLLESENPAEAALDRAADHRRTVRELRRELLTLKRLLLLGKQIRQDRKLQKLKETLTLLRREGHQKFIIFTQFRTTQDYLARHLTDFRTTPFHGSLSADQKEEAVREFQDKSEIFISTEAGGEGRNLQFADVLFNYDLPWSPLKIEQRIGRIHRFGQKNNVKIINFSTRDTVAERVLEVLQEKIRLFEESIGPSDSLLGELEDETDFHRSIMDFAVGRKSRAELNREIEMQSEIARDGYQKLNELITPRQLDFNLNDYYEYTRKNRNVDNDVIERLTRTYLRINPTSRYTLRVSGKRGFYRYDDGTDREKEAVFNSELALGNESFEFLAVGHPLVDEALAYFLEDRGESDKIIRLCLPENGETGLSFVFLCRYENRLERAELISCIVDPQLRVRFLERPPATAPFASPGAFSETALRRATEKALQAVREEARMRGLEHREKIQKIFKSEEFKLEIDSGKKIRRLEEKRDRQRLRLAQEGRRELKAALQRTQNELKNERLERELDLERIRRSGRLELHLHLVEIGMFVPPSVKGLVGTM